MLQINNYSSSILHNISFSLNTDENLVILGQNGAGKSTLAKVLSNLIENSNVRLFDENIDQISHKKRSQYINYIPPKFEIFDEYVTLQEYLELSFIKEVDFKKINEIINKLKLKHLKNRYCIDFSSGEKQLVLLASSLIHNAKITIFDELTANLDISRLKEVFDIFSSNDLNQKIIITHNLDLAYALKYKIMYLQNGKIEFYDDSSKFFTNENLKRFYNDSIIKVNEHLVVNL